MHSITIDSKEAAIETLRGAIKAYAGSQEFDSIKFEGWPKLTIHLTGRDFHQTITTSVMKRLIDLQSQLNQAYCLIVNGNSSTSNMTLDERAMLELVVSVDGGSSLFNVDLEETLNRIVTEGVKKMSGAQIASVILGVAVIFGTEAGISSFLDDRKEIRMAEIKAEEQKDLLSTMSSINQDQQETYREAVGAIRQAYSERSEDILELASETMNTLVKVATVSETADIQGVPVSQEQASLLVASKRAVAEEIRLDNAYYVDKADFTDPDGFSLRIRREGDDFQLSADLQEGTLNRITRSIVSKAMIDKEPIDLQINAKRSKGEIRGAVIVDISSRRAD